jgi:DNA-directed RNA polymerase subunit M/transcription elongation factor TFIIS
MKKKVNSLAKLYCEVCNYKNIVKKEELNSFQAVEFIGVQKNITKLVEGKPNEILIKERESKYKCPQCGRLITVKYINE